jgi:hypothetical protein
LHIANFFDDPNDQELSNLTPFLKFIRTLEDVRPVSEWLYKFQNSEKFSYQSEKGMRLIYKKGNKISEDDEETSFRINVHWVIFIFKG